VLGLRSQYPGARVVSSEVIRRHTYGIGLDTAETFIGIATVRDSDLSSRADFVRVVRDRPSSGASLDGYGAVLTDLPEDNDLVRDLRTTARRVIHSAGHVEHIKNGDVLKLDFTKGYVRSLYRVDSPHNVIFATDRCNSNCLMCSQPPKDVDDTGIVEEHLRLISLIPATTRQLGITGGEPTLLGEGLVRIIAACKDRLPVTRLHMLTNGRLFRYRKVAARLGEVGHPALTLGVPLYSDRASAHDYVVQADGAFDQTMVGLHNLARYGLGVEIRIVVHKETYARLLPLAQFIYRNCPFASHVAFMGLELMGYTKTNLKQLWIDPIDYQAELEAAVMYLARVGMNVSIYNHQLCVLSRPLWRFARKSISDFKNIYLDACQQCTVLDQCGGLFKSAEQIHSAHIRPIG
jgi:His-Xaa-Ser system radical SAM maturase HxsC